MNIAYKNMYALIFSVVIVTPMSGMKNDIAHTEIVTESVVNSVVWYKKPAFQAAAAITTVATGYAFAVRMGKVAIPAFLATLFAAKFYQEAHPVEENSDTQNVQNNDVQNNAQPADISVQNSEDQIRVITFDEQVMHARKQFAEKLDMMINGLKKTNVPTLDQYKEVILQTTTEDLHQMNEDLHK